MLQNTEVPRSVPTNKVHPLDFATSEELSKAVDLIREHFASKNRNLRFCRVELKEPHKKVVLAYEKDPNVCSQLQLSILNGFPDPVSPRNCGCAPGSG